LLHVVFGHSAAMSLRNALKDLDRDERVAMYPDDLGYGPINPPSIEARAEFWGDVMFFEDNPTIADQTNAFWADVAANVENQVAWFSRLSVRELAGFHEYVSRRVSPPLFVDVADVPFVNRDGTPSPIACECFGFVGNGTFTRMNLMSRVARMTAQAFDDTRRRWERLKQEDARLRVLDSSGLGSAPLTYFDETIVASVSSRLDRVGNEVVENATSDWQKCARVVGDASYRCNSRGFDQVHDSFMWFRLRELMDTDRLASKGDTSSMRDSFVRLRQV
jgi:Protein of unknown function/Domain of unknown function (DUF1835)